MNQGRPIVVSILAMLDYLMAGYGLFIAIVGVLPATVRAAVSDALDQLARSDITTSLKSWSPLGWIAAGLALALVKGLLAYGLWKLKNWARIVTIVLCVPISGRFPSTLYLLNSLFPTPATYLLGYAVSFLLFLYLVSPEVRSAFGVTTPRRRWLVPAVSALVLVCFSYDLYKSGHELETLRWHMRNGNRISVKGVSFPVYSWYAPVQESTGEDFEIHDKPGPLRKDDAYGAYFAVHGESDSNLSVQTRLDDKTQGYERAGYTDVSRFQLQVAQEKLDCMHTTFLNTTYINCYGDGPIAYIAFSGGQRSLDRFNKMMAGAQ